MMSSEERIIIRQSGKCSRDWNRAPCIPDGGKFGIMVAWCPPGSSFADGRAQTSVKKMFPHNCIIKFTTVIYEGCFFFNLRWA